MGGGGGGVDISEAADLSDAGDDGRGLGGGFVTGSPGLQGALERPFRQSPILFRHLP